LSNYTVSTNFSAKDSLPSGNAAKLVKGTEIAAEFSAIETAIATKADTISPALTGTPTAPTASVGTDSTQIATTAFLQDTLDTLFAKSHAASGYQKLAGGLIVQWGSNTSSAGAASNVVFPLAFPSAVRAITITPSVNGQPVFATVDSQSALGMGFSVWNTAGSRVSVGAFWVAVGY
jgi:hypothetical protein